MNVTAHLLKMGKNVEEKDGARFGCTGRYVDREEERKEKYDQPGMKVYNIHRQCPAAVRASPGTAWNI